MTVLFGREAKVVVDTIEFAIDPTRPNNSLTVAFSIERTLKPEPNVAEIKIWNMNETHRAQLEELDKVSCSVHAGYKGQIAMLFLGVLREVWTVREGPDLVTCLQSGDGEKEYQQSRISLSVAKGTTNAALLQQIVKALRLGEGNLSTITPLLFAVPPMFPQGGVLSGSASQIFTRVLQSLGFEWSIQDGAVQILQIGSPLTATAVFLTPDTGLVGSPSVDNKGILTAKALMIPDIFPGRLLVLNSERLTGNYRIEACQYSGDIAGQDWYVEIEAKKL